MNDGTELPSMYNFVNGYLKSTNCIHEIDILNIDMSSLLYTLPSYNIYKNKLDRVEELDQNIYEILINNIVEKDLSKTSLKLIYSSIIDRLMLEDIDDSISINYNEFNRYYVDLYNIVNRTVDNYTKGYMKLNQLEIFDNIIELDQFYTIADISINASHTKFMFRLNIALFRRNKDGTNS